MQDIFVTFMSSIIDFSSHSFFAWLIMFPAIIVACLGVFSLIPGKR